MGSSLLPSRLRYRMWAEGLRGTAVSDEAPDKTVVNDFYTHRLDKLLGISGVKDALHIRGNHDLAFQINWNTVRDWSEASRYDFSISEAKARYMHSAVADATGGVLPWLKTQWQRNN